MSKKAPAAAFTRDQISADIEAFLKKGGEITQVQKGVSGYQPNRGSTYAKSQKTSPQKPAVATAD